MDSFFTEMHEQPEALHTLVRFYAGEGRERLVTAAQQVTAASLLTGMGASYHAAAAMLPYWHHLGLGGAAVEAIDLIYYGDWQRAHAGTVVYLSQSGASAEVVPLADCLPADTTLIGVTNETESPLARRAALVLPIVAGSETLVACKTYINSLALLWLLGRSAAGVTDGGEMATLDAVADRIAMLLTQGNATVARWQEAIGDAERLVFVGHGPQAITARHSAMMMAEWAKRPVLSMGVGAFRHGFIESVQPGDGIVVFASPGTGAASAQAIAPEIDAYGGRMMIVTQGEVYPASQVPPADPAEEWLSPLLDVIPAQLVVRALAAKDGVSPGFRHITKVTTHL